MRKTAILAGAGAVALGFSCTICDAPALAQGSNANSSGFVQKIDLNKLPKADKIIKAPPRISITDERPQVTDNREGEVNHTVILQIAPLGAAQTQTTVIQVPGNGAGQGTANSGSPGGVMLNLSRPPRSRFGTNIPSGGMAPAASLPNGTSTNRLMGAEANARGKMMPQQPIKRGGLFKLINNNKPASSAPTPTLKYADDSSTGTGASTIEKKVTVDVHGKVKRGEYLKPPH